MEEMEWKRYYEFACFPTVCLDALQCRLETKLETTERLEKKGIQLGSLAEQKRRRHTVLAVMMVTVIAKRFLRDGRMEILLLPFTNRGNLDFGS